MADDSVLVSFSALHVHQNTELNPDAPEYIPILHHQQHHHHHSTTTTNSSTFFYFHQQQQQPYFPPPPPPAAFTFTPASCYFQPLIHLNPQPHFTNIRPHPPVQHRLTWSQPCADQVQGSDDIGTGERGPAGNGNESRRCWGGRWRRRGAGARIWSVKSRRRSSTTEPVSRRVESGSDENRASGVTLTSSSVNESQPKEESSEWRTVKYKAFKKLGKKFEIQPVEKSVKKTTVMIRNIPSRYTYDVVSQVQTRTLLLPG